MWQIPHERRGTALKKKSSISCDSWILIFSGERSPEHSGNSFNSSLARFGTLRLPHRAHRHVNGAKRKETQNKQLYMLRLAQADRVIEVVSVPALGKGSHSLGDKSRQVTLCQKTWPPPWILLHGVKLSKQGQHNFFKSLFVVIWRVFELQFPLWELTLCLRLSYKISNYTKHTGNSSESNSACLQKDGME